MKKDARHEEPGKKRRLSLTPVARIISDFPEKFGIPRQSGLVEGLEALVVFEKSYRDRNALRGLETYSHLWLLWEFSLSPHDDWSPMVRPPRLGGNERVGVFASRSPFRPNPLGLSCVRLLGIEEHGELGSVLRVGGADLLNGTPIYDIKPYLPISDCRPEAIGGYAAAHADHRLAVTFADAAAKDLPPEKRDLLVELLAQDPRPSYQDEPERVYGFFFAEYEIHFRVEAGKACVLAVRRVNAQAGAEKRRMQHGK